MLTRVQQASKGLRRSFSSSGHIKNALVTGSGSGIGRAIAKQLGASGHHVIIADINYEAAQETAEMMTKANSSAEPFRLDVCSQSEIDSIPKKFKQVDIVVNNAGIQYVAKLEEFPPEKYRQLIEVMLTAPSMITRAVLPGMYANNYGRIINIGSFHSHVASPYKSAYNAAKHGLLGFAKTIALEAGTHDITINTVCPGYVRTPLVEKQLADSAREYNMTEQEVIEKILLAPSAKKAFISPEELAGAVEFLISPAARNMTGQTLTMDGGWTAR